MVDLQTSTRRRRRCGLMVLASLGVLGCGACQPGEPAPEPEPSVHAVASPTGGASSPSSSSVTPSPSAAVSSPSPSPSASEWESFPPAEPGESPEVTAIREAWEAYETQYDRFAKDSSLTNLNELTILATGDEVFATVHSLGALRDEGVVRKGNFKYSNVTVTPPGKDAKAPRVATLTACKDASNSRLVDEETGLPPSKKELRQKLPRITVTWSLEQLPNKRWAISGGSAVEGC